MDDTEPPLFIAVIGAVVAGKGLPGLLHTESKHS